MVRYREILIPVGVGVAGLIAGYVAGKSSSNKSSTKKRARAKSKVRKTKYKHKKGQRYTPHTAGKGRDTSHKRIRYTKKGQPYIIKADGKARFIKKSSAHRSHKQKGGRY